MSANNCLNSLPLLIFEKRLHLTSKNFKIFRNTPGLFFRLTQMNLDPFLSGLFTHWLGLRPNQILMNLLCGSPCRFAY